MDNLNVLITGAGAPGIQGTLHSLKKNFDRRVIHTIGTDIHRNVVGRFLCDRFYQISKPDNPEYLPQLLSICKKERIDVLLPQNTTELSVLAEHKNEFESIGTVIALSDKKSIEIANNKYELLKLAEKNDIPVPIFYSVNNFDDLLKYAKKLGWPEVPVVVKPPVSNGMRGMRIIDEFINLKDMFYHEKPTGIYLRMEDLQIILGSSFPDLLVMEYLQKEEYTVDVLSEKTSTIIPRKRDMIKTGITFNGTVEKNEKIIKYSEKLSEIIGLKYAHGFQFKLDSDNVPKLLESNPRIQGTMVLSTFAGANIIYGAVKYALNEDIPELHVKWGTKILRYWGGIGTMDDNIVGKL